MLFVWFKNVSSFNSIVLCACLWLEGEEPEDISNSKALRKYNLSFDEQKWKSADANDDSEDDDSGDDNDLVWAFEDSWYISRCV